MFRTLRNIVKVIDMGIDEFNDAAEEKIEKMEEDKEIRRRSLLTPKQLELEDAYHEQLIQDIKRENNI